MYTLPEFNLCSIPDGGVVAVLGRRGTGKTTIVLNIMREKRRIPDGIGCSGSEESNSNLAKFMPPSYIYTDYNRDAIERAVSRARLQNRERERHGLPKKYTFIIIDDCACDDAFTKDKTIKRILMNGRHYGIFFIFTMQYPLLVKPDLRSQIDYVFMCRDPIASNRRRLWESYAGVIPTLAQFNEVMDAVCQDYRCLVIAQNQTSNNVEDCVFHYKAKTNLPPFRVGSNIYWESHFRNFNPHHESDEDGDGHVFESSSSAPHRPRKYKTIVKLV